MIGFRNGRESDASLMRQPFFLFDNKVVRVFGLKDRLVSCGRLRTRFVGGYVLKLHALNQDIPSRLSS